MLWMDNQSESEERAEEIHRAPYIDFCQASRERRRRTARWKLSFWYQLEKEKFAKKSFHVGLLQKHISSRYIFRYINNNFMSSLPLSFSLLGFLSHISELFLDCSHQKTESFPSIISIKHNFHLGSQGWRRGGRKASEELHRHKYL